MRRGDSGDVGGHVLSLEEEELERNTVTKAFQQFTLDARTCSLILHKAHNIVLSQNRGTSRVTVQDSI